MKKLLSILLTVTMAVSLAACGGSSGSGSSSTTAAPKQETTAAPTEAAKTEAAPAETPAPTEAAKAEAGPDIHLGVLAPLTGSFAEHGKGFQVAMTMAANEINAAGGVDGRNLVLHFTDTEGDQKKTADAATAFVEDDDILAILGDFSSGCSLAAAPIVTEAGVVELAPTASNVAFAQTSNYCFSIAGKSSAEVPFLVKYVVSKYCGAKTVAVLGLNSDWGVSAFDAFHTGAEEAGVEILVEEQYASGETDFSAMITKVKNANPDMICILDQSPAVLINQIKAAGLTQRICAQGPSTSTEVLTLCGDNAEGMLVTGAFFLEPDNAFVKGFTEAAGFSPTVQATSAYASVYILADAMKRCNGDITRENIRTEVEKTDDDYEIGHVKFDPDGNLDLNYIIAEAKGGVWTLAADYDFSAE